MTTFTHTDEDGDELTIEADGEARALAGVFTDHGGGSVYVEKLAAPALALALLETSGATLLDGSVAQAVTCLRSHLAYRAAEKERLAAEARAEELRKQEEDRLAEEKALDEEALVLLNTYRDAMGLVPAPSFEGFGRGVADLWRATARKARELHA